MFVSALIWIESVITTNNKLYSVKAAVASQNDSVDCIMSVFADGIANKIPTINQCYQITGNYSPPRDKSPAMIDVHNMFPFVDTRNRILDVNADEITPMALSSLETSQFGPTMRFLLRSPITQQVKDPVLGQLKLAWTVFPMSDVVLFRLERRYH